MRKPELDYAFLAGYAAIRNGSLTALDASFTEMRVPQTQQKIEFSLAGRIRADAQAQAVPLRIEVVLPGDYAVAVVDVALPTSNAVRYDGKAGVMFSFRFNLPAVNLGLHVIRVSVDGGTPRELKFDLIWEA